MSKDNIPSDEEFARASAEMEYDNRGLGDVVTCVRERFHGTELHEFFVLYSARHNAFGAFIFYELDSQIEEAAKSGLTDQIKQVVIEELVNIGRGTSDSLKVVFEVDSHQNVERNYEGDYFLRLR